MPLFGNVTVKIIVATLCFAYRAHSLITAQIQLCYVYFCFPFSDDWTEEKQAETWISGSSSGQPSRPNPLRGSRLSGGTTMTAQRQTHSHTLTNSQPLEQHVYWNKVRVKRPCLQQETLAVSPLETAPCINANVMSGIALSLSSVHTLVQTNSSVNDWPNTAHICQCGVSVPDELGDSFSFHLLEISLWEEHLGSLKNVL